MELNTLGIEPNEEAIMLPITKMLVVIGIILAACAGSQQEAQDEVPCCCAALEFPYWTNGHWYWDSCDGLLTVRHGPYLSYRQARGAQQLQ